MSDKDDLLILGTGAMACLFGARLSAVADVTLMGTWAAGLAALENDGIELHDADGSKSRVAVRVVRDPGQCRDVRTALVLVKSWQTDRAVRQLRECLHEDGVALTLQNGLGNLEALQAGLGVERAALGVTTTGATLLGPGKVRAGGNGPTYLAHHPRLEGVLRVLRDAGFSLETVDDLDLLIWRKLAINAGINPITALLGVPNGKLVENDEARQLMKRAANEVAEVAAAMGVDFGGEDAGEFAEEVARRTAANLSSMLQDLQRGAPTEIDAICGAIVKHGEELGVPVPTNWVFWKIIQACVMTRAEGERP